MGIEEKHWYRFNFLRSEKWRGERLATLAEQSPICTICDKTDWHNDVHHILYGKSSKKVVLCRTCHALVHSLTPKDSPPGFRKGLVSALKNNGARCWICGAHQFKLFFPTERLSGGFLFTCDICFSSLEKALLSFNRRALPGSFVWRETMIAVKKLRAVIAKFKKKPQVAWEHGPEVACSWEG